MKVTSVLTNYFFYLALGMAAILGGCTLEPVNNNNTSDTNTSQQTAAKQSNDGDYVFSGNLDGRALLLRITVQGKALSGGYYFTDAPTAEIKIAGQMIADQAGELTEIDASGAVTANLKGIFNQNGTVNVTRTPANATTAQQFTLTPVSNPAAYKVAQ